VLCPQGSIADSPTDINGHTQWADPLAAGCCGCGVKIRVSTNTLAQTPFSQYYFNSPDLNCDYVVNLSDVVVFATYYFGDYYYCADFYWDGPRPSGPYNLSDIVVLATHMQHTCP
jgi:hypothetical protein